VQPSHRGGFLSPSESPRCSPPSARLLASIWGGPFCLMSRSSATVLSAACLALTAASADCGHHQGSSLAFLPAVPTPPAVRPHGSLSIPCRRTLPATSGTSFFLPSTQPHGPLSVRCAEDSSGGEAQADGLPTEHEAGRSNSPGYPIPSLGRLVITDLELNVPRRAGKKALGDGLLGADEPQIQARPRRARPNEPSATCAPAGWLSR